MNTAFYLLFKNFNTEGLKRKRKVLKNSAIGALAYRGHPSIKFRGLVMGFWGWFWGIVIPAAALAVVIFG